MRSRSEPDPYAVLGVPRNATPDEIKAAYRDLVAKYHPDRHQGNPLEALAAAKLAEINRAYEILSDPERRAAYDLGQPFRGQPFARGASGATYGATYTVFSGGGRKRKPWLLFLGLLLLLPLLIRLGVFAVRMAARAFRFSVEGLSVMRGTPVALVVMVLALAVVVTLFVRRRRRRRR
jgi:curved DNA-binding protein CbpA